MLSTSRMNSFIMYLVPFMSIVFSIPNIAYMSALKYCRQTTAQTAGEHINLLYSQTSFELYNYNIKLDTEAAFLFYGGIKFMPVW